MPGDSTNRGIQAQNILAVLIFLENVTNRKFTKIELEPKEGEDFTIHFSDGKKVFYESKYLKQDLQPGRVKEILEKILSKEVRAHDEVVIACKNLSESFKRKHDRISYYGNENMSELTDYFDKKFSQAQIGLLQKTSFDEFAKEELRKDIEMLLREQIKPWLPGERLKTEAKNLIDTFLTLSGDQGSYTVEDFESFKDNIRERLLKNSSTYEEQKESLKHEKSEIIRKIENENRVFLRSNNFHSLLTADTELLFFLIDYLGENLHKDIEKWQKLLSALAEGQHRRIFIDILKNNLNSDHSSPEQVVEIIKNNYEKLAEKHTRVILRRDFQRISLSLIEDALDQGFYDDSVKSLVVKILNNRNPKQTHGNRGKLSKNELRSLASLIESVFTKESNKRSVVEDVIPAFDLVYDSGNFNHRTPQKVFEILYSYLTTSLEDKQDFEDRLKQLTTIFLEQYKSSDIYIDDETGESQFDGYEWVGGGMSATNDSYSVSENHFVRHVLRPALNEYHNKYPERAYNFVKECCIHRNDEGDIEVNENNPDFLLRACIDVVLREYSDSENSEEALSILKEFMSSGRGIPNKPALIFESIHNDEVELTDDKKQKLVDAQLEIEGYNGMPANVFVEKIIPELALEGYEESKEKLKEIVASKDYLSRSTFDGGRIPSRIETLLSDDLELAFELCKEFLDTDVFTQEFDTFHASKMGEVVQLMLAHDELQEKTLSLLRELSEKDNLTKTEQVVLTRSLCDPTNKDPDEEYLLFVFDEFLKPLLESLDNDIGRDYESGEHGEIYDRISLNLARENIVEFASKLADAGCFDEALHIVGIFIDDPHPFEGYVDDPGDEDKNNMHQKIQDGDEAMVISTVRGRCGWVLRKCINPEAQDRLPEIIELTEKLLEDKNYFVQIHAILSLSILAKNRLKFMSDSDELFFAVEDDREQALERSKKIENCAFEVLDKVLGYGADLQKAFAKPLAKLLVQLRELNQSKAEKLVEKLSNATEQVIIDCSVVFLYFAELRDGDYSNWGRKADGLYDDLGSYDPAFAREVIQNLIEESREIKREFSNRFTHLPKNIDTEKGVDIALKYYPMILEEYDWQTFRNFYRFLRDNLDRAPDGLSDLLIEALETQRQYYQSTDTEQLDSRQQHTYTHFGELLQVVNEHTGSDAALESLGIIQDFPDNIKVRLAEVEELLEEKIGTDKSQDMLDKLKEKPNIVID